MTAVTEAMGVTEGMGAMEGMGVTVATGALLETPCPAPPAPKTPNARMADASPISQAATAPPWGAKAPTIARAAAYAPPRTNGTSHGACRAATAMRTAGTVTSAASTAPASRAQRETGTTRMPTRVRIRIRTRTPTQVPTPTHPTVGRRATAWTVRMAALSESTQTRPARARRSRHAPAGWARPPATPG